MKNIILLDFEPSANWSLLHYLNTYSSNWHCKSFVSNWNGRIKRIFKYIVFFAYPLFLLFNRKKYKCIISWQQFYGLNFAFWSRLFHLRKRNRLIILTFIYKQKKGCIGKIYYKFIEFIITSQYIDSIVCYSKNEVSYYCRLFPTVRDKFEYMPLGMEKIETDMPLRTSDYIFSTGRSNRDYTFLTEALANTRYKLKIACDYLPRHPAANIEILNNCHRSDMIDVLKECYCVCISLDNPHISAGQLVILQATQLGKPVIITKSDGVTDYILNGYNGYIISKDKTELLSILNKIYNDNELYEKLSDNCKTFFNRQHSMESMAKNLIDLTHRLDIEAC